LPNYSFDDIFGMLTADDEKSAALLDDLLANPESLDQHTIEMLQARAKEELAQQQLLEEEEIKRMGGSLGIEDSNWLKSERLASRRDRDMGVVKSNRDIEIEAARTNTADKRAAAQLGLSYDTMKSGERQAAAALAADVTLKQAALRGDRMALQESVKQKAAELGISEDQVMSSWLLGLADDATRNRAISAEDARSIRELAQRDKEFGYEIAYRLAALAQQDEQFGAQWGLDWTRLQHDIDQDHYGRYTDTF
jgi:pyruvate/2-oxoglutarate dehydrogenase complex dihydrolipoamide acyltransferase (E2) component